MFVGFVSIVGDGKIIHCTAYGYVFDIQIDLTSKVLLDEMQHCCSIAFIEP